MDDGAWLAEVMDPNEARHVDYPHLPGRLIDCPACEDGPCQCDPATDAPCVSVHCVQGEGD